MLKKSKGITLIALVVTIIVLLILAGVTLNFVAGENGILKRATDAVEINEKATAEEEANLLIADLLVKYYEEKYVNNNGSLTTLDNYLKEQISSGKETDTGEYTVKIKGEEVIVSKGESDISKGILENGRVDWIGDSSGGNAPPPQPEEPIKENYEKYIEDHFQVDKIIYISSQNGNDSTGNGTEIAPYASLDKISEAEIIENGYSYAIVLMDGEYELTTKIFNLNCNKEVNILGNKEKTRLNVGTLYGVDPYSYGGGSQSYYVNIYRLVWSGDIEGPNTIFLHTKLSLYNVAFDIHFLEAIYGYYISCGSGYYFYNCTLPTAVNQFLRSWRGGEIRLTNCYGGFTSGYETSDTQWNYQTNSITQNPLVDEKYRITDEESVWKNIGTGTNPDGLQANLGVYGGEYSWEK